MLVSEFLTNLKSRGQYQSAQTVLSDDDYIRMANDQMQMVIVPKIIATKDSYFNAYKDYTLSSSRRYRLPARCVGGIISSIKVIVGSETYTLNQVSNLDDQNSYRQGFYVSQGDIILTGSNMPTGTMRVTYPCMPPEMNTTASQLAVVTTVGSSSVGISTTALAGTTRQVIRSSGGYRTVSPSVACSSTIGTDNDCTDYQRYQPGDIFIAQNSTHLVPLERPLIDWLLQRTHMRILGALGFRSQMQLQGAKLQDIQSNALSIITPRVQDSPKLIFGLQTAGVDWRY